jgi:hypothetical protein
MSGFGSAAPFNKHMQRSDMDRSYDCGRVNSLFVQARRDRCCARALTHGVKRKEFPYDN